MAKLKNLDDQMEKVLNAANVTAEQTKAKEELFDTPVRNIPLKYKKILKDNGYTVSGYMKTALRRCLKQDGLID
jgi:hypothetical protein